MTRFFGMLLVINVAVGVVTALVQELQFVMGWSAYSRFVGDAADELLELVGGRLVSGHLGGDHELVC